MRWHHRFLILGFYEGKSAKNGPKMRYFQNLPKTRQKKGIYMKQVPSPSFLGKVSDKKWTPFIDLGVRSPIFHPKSLKMAVFG